VRTVFHSSHPFAILQPAADCAVCLLSRWCARTLGGEAFRCNAGLCGTERQSPQRLPAIGMPESAPGAALAVHPPWDDCTSLPSGNQLVGAGLDRACTAEARQIPAEATNLSLWLGGAGCGWFVERWGGEGYIKGFKLRVRSSGGPGFLASYRLIWCP